MRETVIINGQPQISLTFGNRMVTYDGLFDFLTMLKDEIPKMGVDNYIANKKSNNYLFGSRNQSYGQSQFAVGHDNYLGQSLCGFILGANNTVEGGDFCFAFGNQNNADSVSNAYGFGNHLTLSNNATWIGQYNRNHERLTNVVFGIGNGENEEERHNALIITKDNTLVLNPFAHSYSSDADNIKNNVFINSCGRSNENILTKDITNSVLIGQLAGGTIGNINRTVIIGACPQAQGLEHSLLLGDYHTMGLQSNYGEDLDNSFKPFQVFAFGSGLQVPNTSYNSFYARQADYPIFVMGTGIYNREGNDQEAWTPYAMVVGNKNEQRNVFTLDYQGSINALSLNVEYLTVSNSASLPVDVALSMKNQLLPVNQKLGYWYTDGQSILQINKYDQNIPAPGVLTMPSIIEFYAGNRNNAQQKATIKADTFEADTKIQTDKISANEMSMGIFEYDTTNSNTINCTVTDVPTFWWARIRYTFNELVYNHSNNDLDKTYYNVTAENCILVATTRTANNTAGSICSVFQGSSEWATTERQDNLITFTGKIACSYSSANDTINLTLKTSELICGSETTHTFTNQTPSRIEVSIMPFYGHQGE